MKLLFYISLLLFVAFEFLNVYFIMPMPGSQVDERINLAYFLYSWRWLFRILLLAALLYTIRSAFKIRWKWIPAFVVLIVTGIIYVFNYKMSADHMFLQPENVTLKSKLENRLPINRLVISIENNGEAKAYPISFIGYHHQVQDVIGGKPVIVTYCTVCRTGRVFEPVVNGKPEKFRLVGMDHFNAMFEDESTGSWWRQANGEAVAGKLKGKRLNELPSRQMTVEKFFQLYPQGLIMQADEASVRQYDSLARYEQGMSKGSLTRTDSLSWQNKSWIVGLQDGTNEKAYDWNLFKKHGIIHDTLGKISVVLVLSTDGQSFAVFERPPDKFFTLRNDTLFTDADVYDFSGRDLSNSNNHLRSINAYQEFWHSWSTFHPNTRRYH